jgi:signal transduction histidine kinase/DNA-binding NarL/FixJ family response regulator
MISANELHSRYHTEFWNGDVGAYDLTNAIQIAKISDTAYSKERLFSDSTIQWISNKEINLLTSKDSVYWVKFSVQNDLGRDFSAYFFFNAWKRIELFRLDSNHSLLDRRVTGNNLKLSDRDVQNRRIPFIQVNLHSDKVNYFVVRLVHGGEELWFDDSSEKISVLISRESDILSTENTIRIVLGFSVGLIMMLILFTFFLYFITRNLSALYNGLFLLFFELFYISAYGISFEYFWPNSILWDLHSQAIFLAFCVASLCQFFRYSLALKQTNKRFDQFYQILSFACITIIISQLLHMRNLNEILINVLFTMTFSSGVYISYKSWKNGNDAAKYYFVGISYMHVFQIFIALSQNGVVPYYYGAITNFDLAQYGATLQVSLYCYGLVKAYKSSQDEILNEITKRVIAENKAISLEELEQSKSQFFSTMSHEFRTPLTLIINAIHSFAEKNDHQKNVAFRSISTNSKRLLRIINHLLDFSKLEARQMGLHIQKYDLIRFTRFLMNNFKSAAESKNIKIKLFADVDELVCDLDYSKLEKVLLNLFSNALKFTEKGAIEVHIVQTGPWVEIDVRDSGIGIEKNHLNYVFDRFYQVDQGVQREYEGTGIGLSLCKELVVLHKGHLTVQSEVEKGSSFLVQLPFANNEVVAKWQPIKDDQAQDLEQSVLLEYDQPLKGSNPKAVAGNTILIIEDQKEMRTFLKTLLDDKYYVYEAHNGEKGIELAKTLIPDLILSDVMMPKMDGLSMLSELKSSFETRHIPVVLISGKADEDGRIDGISRGAIDYIVKPFDAKQLRFKVASVLQMYSHFRDRLKESLTFETQDDVPENADEQFLIQLKKYIQNNLQDVSADSLASAFALSKSTLFRKVKALTGDGSNMFIKRIKLQSAKLMLDQSNATIASIASDCGFRSASYFSKSYKEKFGTLPSEKS